MHVNLFQLKYLSRNKCLIKLIFEIKSIEPFRQIYAIKLLLTVLCKLYNYKLIQCILLFIDSDLGVFYVMISVLSPSCFILNHHFVIRNFE